MVQNVPGRRVSSWRERARTALVVNVGAVVLCALQGACAMDASGVDADSVEGGASALSAQAHRLSATELDAVKKALSDQGADAGTGHPTRDVNLPVNSADPNLVRDGKNALLNAIAFSETGDATYAKHAAAILQSWAEGNKSFSGPNGFLNAAWSVSSMVRGAQILKDSGSPEWTKIAPEFTAWAKQTAQTIWLPVNNPLPGTHPEVISRWEQANISNRTMTSIEATMYVARLVEDWGWFDKCVTLYKSLIHYQSYTRDGSNAGTRFFMDATGKNTDDGRDSWHQEAGIASCVQICEMASHVKDPQGKSYDLYPLEGGIVRKSAEHYAGLYLHTNPARSFSWIPFWQTALSHYGAASMPNTKALLSSPRPWWNNTVDGLLNYNWGFPQYL